MELLAILICLFESTGNTLKDSLLLANKIVDDSIKVDGCLLFCLCSMPEVYPYCIKCEMGEPTKWYGKYMSQPNNNK
jgi:hypothetical protein